jgi:DNA modification methylase
MLPLDRAVHDWYRFVLSFPPHLVREYVRRFNLGPGDRVMDPFCGTGTTLVECKKLGIESVGVEANPLAAFAASVKTDWSPDPGLLREHSAQIAERANRRLERSGIPDTAALFGLSHTVATLRALPAESARLLLSGSINPLSVHKALELIDVLGSCRDDRFDRHQRLALAKALVFSASNLAFGPEVGVGASKPDAPVVAPWLAGVREMASDLAPLGPSVPAPSLVHMADARSLGRLLSPRSIDAVITSPPYPNEKDYTRTTRLESVFLGFVSNQHELRALKRTLLRSNTRGVYKADDDDQWVDAQPEIQRIAVEVEERRKALGKTSGFERMYARVTKLYFGGMARHLAELRAVLRPGARLAYVVGDQASYLRVMIRTGEILARLAVGLGYEVEGIDLFRTRLATATRAQLREEVVVLRWSGRELSPT